MNMPADKILDLLKTFNTAGTAIYVVKNNEVVFNAGLGLRDVENGLPVTTKTRFDICSLTKAFTSFAIAMLCDRGLLSLDSRISSVLPGFRFSDPYVTRHCRIEDILSHRTGMENNNSLWQDHEEYSRQELLNLIQTINFPQPFGCHYI